MQTRAQHRATAAELYVSDDEEQFLDLALSNTGSIGEDPERTQEINVDEAFYDAVDPYLCYTCKGILDSDDSVGCDKCLQWFHIGCVTVEDSEEQQEILSSNEDSKWFCPTCRIPSPLSQALTEARERAKNVQAAEDNSPHNAEPNMSSNIGPNIHIPPVGNSNGDIQKAKWGKLSGLELLVNVNKTYKKVVKWRRNIFSVPSGKAGKAFVEEMARTIGLFTRGSNWEAIALTMTMILPPLLLQKPSKKSKSKDHVQYLEKRLGWWKDGDLDLLLKEGEAIQKRLKNSKFSQDDKEKVFTRLMLQGKVSAAMRWIGQNSTSVLAVNDEIETKLYRGWKES